MMTIILLLQFSLLLYWASLVALLVKNLPAMQETWISTLGPEDPLEKKMATHSSILAWGVPWTEEPGGLQSVGSPRIGYTEQLTLTWFLYQQHTLFITRLFPPSSVSKESACNAGSIPRLGRSPGGGCSNPLQYSCLAGYSPWGHKNQT